jgi:hypothetical protein
MMREKQHSHNDDDDVSSYIQLRNPNSICSKSKQTFFTFTYIRFYLIGFVVLLLTVFILFSSQKSSNTYKNHRLKRQILSSNYLPINLKQHYTNMLHRILLHRTSSSVLADCTINMASEGIYHLPTDNSLSSEIIQLVEKTFDKEVQSLKRTAKTIRQKMNQTSDYFGDFALAKFQDDFSISIRFLLASQLPIKEINLMLAIPLPNDNNGGSYIYYDTIKYYRVNNGTNGDYDSIYDVKLKQNGNIILQTFTPSNARETLKQTMNNNYTSIYDGWWIGPVLCEKNKNETFIMAHIFPLTNR